MDLRKEILTGMLRTTGSKRVSVIIQDKKGRYLIAERAGVAEEPIEFPSFSCKDTRLPEGDEGITLVTEGIKEVIGIEIKDRTVNGMGFFMNKGDKAKQIRDYLMIICIQLICTVFFLSAILKIGMKESANLEYSS